MVPYTQNPIKTFCMSLYTKKTPYRNCWIKRKRRDNHVWIRGYRLTPPWNKCLVSIWLDMIRCGWVQTWQNPIESLWKIQSYRNLCIKRTRMVKMYEWRGRQAHPASEYILDHSRFDMIRYGWIHTKSNRILHMSLWTPKKTYSSLKLIGYSDHIEIWFLWFLQLDRLVAYFLVPKTACGGKARTKTKSCLFLVKQLGCLENIKSMKLGGQWFPADLWIITYEYQKIHTRR